MVIDGPSKAELGKKQSDPNHTWRSWGTFESVDQIFFWMVTRVQKKDFKEKYEISTKSLRETIHFVEDHDNEPIA
jgi:hypothetical protein